MDTKSKKYSAHWWLEQVKDARRARKEWLKEADDFEQEWNEPKQDGANLFFSNTKLEGPAIYSRVPAVVSKVRYGSNDDVARIGSTLIEKPTRYQAEEKKDFNTAMKAAQHESNFCGRGVVRIRYQKEQEPIEVRVDLFPMPIPGTGQIDPMTGQEIPGTEETQLLDVNGQPAPEGVEVVLDADGSASYTTTEIDIIDERVMFEHVNRCDFNHSAANTWDRVIWVSFDSYLTLDEVEAKYGKKKAEKLNYEHKIGEEKDEEDHVSAGEVDQAERAARITEIWCKRTRKVYTVSPGFDQFLAEIEDPYNLKDFFPCPKPYFVNLQSKKLLTRADYAYYREKVKTYELLLKRERVLIGGLDVKGLFEEAFFEQLEKVKRIGTLDFVPVNMSAIIERGGIKAVIDTFIIPEIAPLLQQIEAEKAQIKQEIFEISGLADIIRGVTDPNETATAQQIKGKFATMRLGDKQKAFQDFARDTLVLAAEFIAENFDDSTLFKLAAMDFEDEEDKALFPKAVALIRRDGLRRISIDIETDSTIAITEELQKEAWVNYLGSVGQVLPNFLQMIQSFPTLAGFFAKLLDAGSRLHRFGSAVEQELEQGVQGLIEQMQQPPKPPEPTIDQQIDMQKVQLDGQKAMMDFQAKVMELQQRQEEMRKENELKYSGIMANMQALAAKLAHDFDMKARLQADSAVQGTLSDLRSTNV